MRRIRTQFLRLALMTTLTCVVAVIGVYWLGEAYRQQAEWVALTPEERAESARTPEDPELTQWRDGQARFTRMLVGGTALTCVLLGVFIGFLHARPFAAPLPDLIATADRLSQGQWQARATVGATPLLEYAQFIGRFNGMAQALETAERQRRESASAIAHELRTPLTVLGGQLHGMLDGVFATDHAALQTLVAQVDQLTHIVDDLRLLTLAEAGHLPLAREWVDLAHEAREILAAITPLAERDGMQIETDLSPALAWADGRRLRQVLQALVHNAMRYGAAPILVTTGHEGADAVLTVADRGPGLSETQREHVFERFWRAEGSRARDHGGSGLGLSVVQAIALAHGGCAGYSPRPGGGAQFWIRIPREAALTPAGDAHVA